MASAEEILNVEEGEEVHTPEPEKKSKKRSRSSKPKPIAKGPGVVIINNHFVCSYSGRIIEKAIFIPGVTTAAFANFPCAFAWIEENVKDAAKQEELKRITCDDYEQTVESVVRAPIREKLSDFGGDLIYDEWMGPLKFWDILTDAQGSSVKDFQASLKGDTKRRGGKTNGRVTFESAMYVVSSGKGAAGCKKINALDGAVEKGAKDRLTPISALRKIGTFTSKNTPKDSTEPLWVQVDVGGDNYRGWAVTPVVGYEPDEKLLNNIATQVCGHKVYGPAVILFTRKTSVKV